MLLSMIFIKFLVNSTFRTMVRNIVRKHRLLFHNDNSLLNFVNFFFHSSRGNKGRAGKKFQVKNLITWARKNMPKTATETKVRQEKVPQFFSCFSLLFYVCWSGNWTRWKRDKIKQHFSCVFCDSVNWTPPIEGEREVMQHEKETKDQTKYEKKEVFFRRHETFFQYQTLRN